MSCQYGGKISEECFLVESVLQICKAVLKEKGVQPVTCMTNLMKWPVRVVVMVWL